MLRKNKKINNSSVCVITLTHNRPEYIERSFESLYKRAGTKIEHFVFDDGSDQKTKDKLLQLKEKYNFNLFLSTKKVGIFKRFYLSLYKIPIDYDYYVKLDSDVEILSDNFFPEILDIFSFPAKIGGVMPRIEGIRNADRYDKRMDFYNGHAIKYDAAAVSGCCMIFPNKMFTSFKRKKLEEIEELEDKWGVDSVLYDHARSVGLFIGVEDLGVYHIDNAYGQRRVNNDYFTERNRWTTIDVDEIWCMNVSRSLAPKFLDRATLDKIKKSSTDFENYIINCEQYLKDKKKFDLVISEKEANEKEETVTVKEDKKPMYLRKMYKITSPLNFGKNPYIPHGTFKYFSEIPDWAKNNIRLVIEQEDVSIYENNEEVIEVGPSEPKKDIRLHITKNSGKIKLECAKCKYSTYSEKRLEKHLQKKHS